MFVEKHYINFIKKNGYIPIYFNPYNETELKDIAPTLSTCCNSMTSSATVLILEDEMSGSAYLRNYGSRGKLQGSICDTLQAAMGSGGGNVPLIEEKYYLSDKMKQYIAKRGTKGYNNPDCKINKIIARPITTDPNKRAGTTNYISRDVGDEFDLNEDSVYSDTEKKLFTEDGNIKRYINSDVVDEFKEGQMATTSFPNGYGHGPRTHNESIALNTIDKPSVKQNLRIRKLTPKECWRLMGFKDESFEKAQKVNSNTQLYKQAGNSIVVNVLEKIIANMNLELEHIRLLELFGGIGACSEAMKNLGLDFEIVDYVEIDKYAVKSYNAINGTNFEPQDIITWNKDIKVDFVMHGSPCQDFSLAGNQAGGDEGSGTRSSLMYETVRIVEKLKPKYVLWENVKNVISKKHRHNFDKYLKYMEDLGYKNYYQVLNAKDYGIPQNRERVFTLSILGGTEYEFPPKEELKLKLKDMLEDSVEEKYHLSDEQVQRIHKSTYNVSKTRIQENEERQTLCARDWEDPKCVRVGGIFDTEKSTHQAGSIYDKNGLAPTLDTMQGGWRQPCIEEQDKWSDLD